MYENMGQTIAKLRRDRNLTQEKLTDVMYEIGMTEGFDIGLEMSVQPSVTLQR